MTDSTEQYLNGSYGEKHTDWHLDDAPYKVQDIKEFLTLLLEQEDKSELKIAEVGAGVGGVLDEVVRYLKILRQDLEVKAVGFEISPFATEIARTKFPELEFRVDFKKDANVFDSTLFIDVLEHLEDPWSMLREAHKKAKYVIVRQPLLENFSTFRHKNYQEQREYWGHIKYFNYYSFLDMMTACGWEVLKIDLVPYWKLAKNSKKFGSPLLQSAIVSLNKVLVSYFLSGFYLNGIFKKIDVKA